MSLAMVEKIIRRRKWMTDILSQKGGSHRELAGCGLMTRWSCITLDHIGPGAVASQSGC